MRKLYLFLTAVLALTGIVATLAASVGLYERYEGATRPDPRQRPVAAQVVGKRSVPEPATAEGGVRYRVGVTILEGERRGEVLWQDVPPAWYRTLGEGQPVQVVMGRDGPRFGRTGSAGAFGLPLLVALLSLAGCGGLIYKIKRMPG